MSAKNCPFKIEKEVRSDVNEKPKSCYISIKVKLDKDDPNSMTIEHEVKKLDSTEVEDVLYFSKRVADTFERLGVKDDDGAHKFMLIENFMEGTALQDFLQVKQEFVDMDRTRDVNKHFQDVGLFWVQKYTSKQIRLDTKEWLNQVKKPRTWTVQQFIQCIQHINSLIPYMPEPLNWMNIVRKAGPSFWECKEIESGQNFQSLSDQARYYQGLRNLETADANNRNRRSNNTNQSYRRNENDAGRSHSSNNQNNTNRRRDYVNTNNGNQKEELDTKAAILTHISMKITDIYNTEMEPK